MSQSGLEWDQKAFEEWRGARAHILKELLPDGEQGLKALVVLALLDNGEEPCTYDWLVETINEQKVVPSINKNSIRTAVSNLKKTIPEVSPYMLETTKAGLNSFLRLIKKPDDYRARAGAEAAQAGNRFQPRRARDTLVNVIVNVDPPVASPDEIAQALVKKNMLPMYALYCLPRGASWWLHFSRQESEQRKKYEASAWKELGIRDLMLKHLSESQGEKVIGVVGMAVGEGLGEIELLRCILEETKPEGKVHYLAVDMSPLLLLAHYDTLQDMLEAELKSGRLVVSATLGNMDQLGEIVQRARAEFAERDIKFLPPEVPILVTCFGNVLGNHTEPNEIISFYTRMRETFKNRPLCMLTGVSIWGWKTGETDNIKDYEADAEFYDPDWYDFLSTTPRHLLLNLKRIHFDTIGEGEAFNPTSVSKVGRQPERFWHRFSKDNYLNFDVRAEIHRFYYTLKGDLRLNSPAEPDQTDEQAAPAAARKSASDLERDILLCVITRFDPQSLSRALRSQGFKVESTADSQADETQRNYKVINVGEETRKYVLIAASAEADED